MEKGPQRRMPILRHPIGSFAVSVVRQENPISPNPRNTARYTPALRRLENHPILRDCVVTVAVPAEPVSAAKFPVARELTGKSRKSEFCWRRLTDWNGVFLGVMETNSLNIGTGNYSGGSGNNAHRTGNLSKADS